MFSNGRTMTKCQSLFHDKDQDDDDDNADAKAIEIPRVFSESSRANNRVNISEVGANNQVNIPEVEMSWKK